MSTGNTRMEELLERWLASVELHERYLQLDDAAYARAEAWPKHQRPNAFVVKLARTRLLEMKRHLAERRDAGDARFTDALELMSFLTSLLGSEHIERFIPLATGKPPDTSISATVEQPRLRTAAKPVSRRQAPAAPAAAHARPAAHAKSGATRAAAPAPAPNATPTSKPLPATSPTPKDTVSRQLVGARPRAVAAAPAVVPAPAAATAPAAPPVGDAMAQQVIADAVRLLAWGREWPAVAGLIARIADRPSEADIWKILRAHRADIMSRAGRGTS